MAGLKGDENEREKESERERERERERNRGCGIIEKRAELADQGVRKG